MVGTMAQAWCSNASLVHAPSAFPFPSPPLSDHYSSSSLFFFFLFKSCPPCHTYSSSSPFSSSWRWGLRAGRGSMDVGAFEAERLRLDSQARARMAQQAAGASSSAVDPRAWKWAIRKRVWDLLEAEGIAREPRPVHHRIPNFSGADAAAAKVLTITANMYNLPSILLLFEDVFS
ncbi:hypothetical protein O6H91_16G095600 [Diphasiastrum complanatum]|uniref:Uncharacterized protein n=1 Tax=Diphasiastrum complanatum TaxID=34168 RepID=A0ACC2BFZ7_DIPCM|nr:hypothetical protein O6H91_16G095600 [Diphasiastrum complanatum]